MAIAFSPIDFLAANATIALSTPPERAMNTFPFVLLINQSFNCKRHSSLFVFAHLKFFIYLIHNQFLNCF